jgi:transcriptional regulator with XRE-family HTH domain
MDLKNNLKQLRNDRKLSQQRVSDMNGIPRSTYSGYENGVAEPNLCTIIKLAKFYKVSVDTLIQ